MKRILIALLCALLLSGCAAPAVQPAAEVQTAAPEEVVQVEQAEADLETAPVGPEETPGVDLAAAPVSMELALDTPYTAVIDGTTVTLTLSENLSESFEDTALTLNVDGETSVLKTEFGMMSGAWLYTPANGAPMLVTCVDLASDDYETAVYAFSGKQSKCLGTIFGGLFDGVRADGTVHLVFQIDVLGTWYGERDYVLTDGTNAFVPVAGSDFALGGEEPLTTVAALPAELQKDGAYTAGTLPAGTKLWVESTDDESYVRFRLEDGSEGRIAFARQEYAITIDGKPEETYFGELSYFG